MALDAWTPAASRSAAPSGSLSSPSRCRRCPWRSGTTRAARGTGRPISPPTGVWRHGDWITITDRGSVVVHGRSDATLNRHGIRMGSSDIYHVVEQLDEIAEALVVGVERPEGEYWMPLFVVLNPGRELDDALTGKIRRAIRDGASPRHVPDEIIAVPAIPHTRTGKKLEIPVKRILQGGDPRQVMEAGAVDNPDALRGSPPTAQGPDPMKISVLIPTTGDIATVREHAAMADQLGYNSVNCSHISARDSFTTLAGLPTSPRRSPWPRRWPRSTTAPPPRWPRRPPRSTTCPAAASGSASAPVTGPRWAAGTGRTSETRWPRCASTSRWSAPCWPAAIRRRPSLELQLRVQRLHGPGRHPYLPGRPVPRHAAPGRRDRRRGGALGLPRLLRRRRGGTRDRGGPGAGRPGLAGFEICAAVPSAVVDDPAVARRGIRAELHRYFGLPFYRAMFAQAGYEADIAAYDAAADVNAQRAAISDAFIEDLCAIGKPADVAAGVARYRAAGATNPMITNITGTDLRPTLHAAVAA